VRVSESVLVVCVGFVLVCAFDLTRLASLLPSALSLVWCVVCAPGCVSLYLSVTLALLINYFLSTLKSTSGVGFGFGREESCCSELLDTRSLLAQRAEHAPTTRSSSGAPTHPRVPRTTSNSSLLRRHSLCRPISVAIIFVPSPLHAHIHRSSPLSPLPPLWHRVYFKSASPPVRFSSSLPPSHIHLIHTTPSTSTMPSTLALLLALLVSIVTLSHGAVVCQDFSSLTVGTVYSAPAAVPGVTFITTSPLPITSTPSIARSLARDLISILILQ